MKQPVDKAPISWNDAKKMILNPDWVSPPGDTIQDMIDEMNRRDGNCRNTFHIALCLLLSMEDTEKLLAGDLEIDEELALKLHLFLGSTKEFWLKREENYRENLKKSRENG